MSGDLDLTEAINAARLAWHAESDACGRGLGGPSAGELADAMIRAAAPIIARQTAERIVERIVNHIAQHEIQPSEKACDVCYGLEIAADIAREVGSGG